MCSMVRSASKAMAFCNASDKLVDKAFSSPVTGSVAPVHHTPWASAMDDSMKTFLNK